MLFRASWARLVLALVFVAPLTTELLAQSAPGTEADGPGNTPHRSRRHPIRSLTLSGELLLPGVYRSVFFDDQFRGNLSSNNDDLFLDPVIRLHLDLDLEENVRARVTLQNDQRTANNLAGSLQEKTVSQLGGEDNLELEVEEIYIQLDRFLQDEGWLRLGIQDFRYALRYDSSDCFFLDISHAESPFLGPVNLEAAGVRTRFALEFFDQILAIDLFGFTLVETGFQSADESIFGLNFDLTLSGPPERDQLVNLLLAGIANDDSLIGTLGLGASIFVSTDLELFGEALVQYGRYFESGQTPLAPLQTQRHEAYGGRIGARYTWNDRAVRPFVEVSAWILSGDDNSSDRAVNRDLVTYENVDDTLLVEGDEYGLDLDSNYWSTRFRVGLDLAEHIGEDVQVELGVAHFESLNPPQDRSHHIGTELDLVLTWHYSSALRFRLGAGFLVGSQFFADATQALGIGGTDHAMILFFETRLRF